ncbi:MAG: hypothetical protein ACREDM_13490 [Methylocella sp.]
MRFHLWAWAKRCKRGDGLGNLTGVEETPHRASQDAAVAFLPAGCGKDQAFAYAV